MNPTLVPGSHTYTNNTTQNDATPLFNGSSSCWTNALVNTTFGNYGVATTSASGLFNAGSIAVGNGGPNYGILAPGRVPNVSGG